MQVKLLETNGLGMIDHAIGQCYDKGCYIEPEKRDKRITKVALKHKHSSVLEFGYATFEITASTKVLLEMTRHRMANYACKSSRYTLNKGEIVFERTGDYEVDKELDEYKELIEYFISMGKSNEVVSLMLPQAYQYRWDVQFNFRSLQNFFTLRRDKSAHYHIRKVANRMFDVLPEEVRYLF